MDVAPKGVMLETKEDIKKYAAQINTQVMTKAMPIGNITEMTDEERDKIAAWFYQGAKTE